MLEGLEGTMQKHAHATLCLMLSLPYPMHQLSELTLHGKTGFVSDGFANVNLLSVFRVSQAER